MDTNIYPFFGERICNMSIEIRFLQNIKILRNGGTKGFRIELHSNRRE